MDIISFNEAATANGRIEKFIKDPDSNSGIVTVPRVIEAGESVTIPSGRMAVLPNVQVDGTLNVETGGEVFIPAGTTLSKVVELEGNQTIAGVKTFSRDVIINNGTTDTPGFWLVDSINNSRAQLDMTGENARIVTYYRGGSPAVPFAINLQNNVASFANSPIVPTATEGNQAVNLETANSYDLGVGQTWQDVTSSRSSGVTYTNNTGKPIAVLLSGINNASTLGVKGFTVDSVKVFKGNVSSQAVELSLANGAGCFIVPKGSSYSAEYSFSSGSNWSELR